MFADHFHKNSARTRHFMNAFADLLRQTLLQLQPTRKEIDDTVKLRNTEYLSVWDISDRAMSEKRQKMVFAKGKKGYIFDDHGRVIGTFEQCAVDDFLLCLMITLRQFFESLQKTLRCFLQTFPLRIFAAMFE